MNTFFVRMTFAGRIQAETAQGAIKQFKEDLHVKPYEDRTHISVWECAAQRKADEIQRELPDYDNAPRGEEP